MLIWHSSSVKAEETHRNMGGAYSDIGAELSSHWAHNCLLDVY